ncbi:hypothetical protein KY290_031636 [Solanum tuberosum]|uniref:Uncharacterized protein n=1 Tax=Solanum tuberosum TaxID=4113 RepID=A0ABQ7UBK4_SOLTU|nr:hypothetical protein KY290_031636 [Solanum tuberosum]
MRRASRDPPLIPDPRGVVLRGPHLIPLIPKVSCLEARLSHLPQCAVPRGLQPHPPSPPRDPRGVVARGPSSLEAPCLEAPPTSLIPEALCLEPSIDTPSQSRRDSRPPPLLRRSPRHRASRPNPIPGSPRCRASKLPPHTSPSPEASCLESPLSPKASFLKASRLPTHTPDLRGAVPQGHPTPRGVVPQGSPNTAPSPSRALSHRASRLHTPRALRRRASRPFTSAHPPNPRGVVP